MTVEYLVSRTARDLRPGDCVVEKVELYVLAEPMEVGEGVVRIPVRRRWEDAETPPASMLVAALATLTVQELA